MMDNDASPICLASTWADLLSNFAQTTGLAVSLYDLTGHRCFGPFIYHDIGSMVATAGALVGEGDAGRLEQRLVKAVVDTARMAEEVFEGGLVVRARPVMNLGVVEAVLVYGWVFSFFPDPLVSERVARRLKLPPNRFWSAARSHRPVGQDRLEVFEGLLDALASSNVGQLRGRFALEEAGQMKDQFLTTLSHELKTPMTSILLRMEMLSRSLRDPDSMVAGHLKAIFRSVRAQSRLIDDLLDTSRILSGKLHIQLQPINVGKVIGQAVETVAPVAQAKGVSLTSEIAVLARDVQGDFARLVQVFWNLLSNAVKFTPAGGKVSVSVHQSSRGVEVLVRDTGIGLRDDQLEKVFIRFYQVPGGVEESRLGIGLGLSLARHIVELHGGTIDADSAGPGTGTTFRVFLPYPVDIENRRTQER